MAEVQQLQFHSSSRIHLFYFSSMPFIKGSFAKLGSEQALFVNRKARNAQMYQEPEDKQQGSISFIYVNPRSALLPRLFILLFVLFTSLAEYFYRKVLHRGKDTIMTGFFSTKEQFVNLYGAYHSEHRLIWPLPNTRPCLQLHSVIKCFPYDSNMILLLNTGSPQLYVVPLLIRFIQCDYALHTQQQDLICFTLLLAHSWSLVNTR